MKLFFISLCIIYFSFCTEEEEFTVENDVIVLTSLNFDKAILKYDYVLVTFYASWCGHCKKLKPEFEKAASILKNENIICGKVDAIVERELVSRFKISGFPKIRFFINSIPIEYNGGRKAKEIINWIRNKTILVTKDLNTLEEVEDFKKINDVCIIYFGKDNEDLKIFNIIALKNDKFPFAVVKDEEISKKLNAKIRSVVLFKRFDEKRNDMDNINEKDITDFIYKYSQKRIKSFDNETTSLIFIRNKPAIVYFGEKGETWEKHEKILEKIAIKYETKLKVVMTEINDEMEKRVAERIGVKNEDLPCIRLVENKIDTIKYIMGGNIEEENILNFIEKWEKNLLNKFLKSEEEPKDNNDIIFKVVGKTYKKEVINNDKDVMVLFYSLESKESMQLLNIYEKVAKKIKFRNPNIILAKIDGSKNEIDSVIIHGFPIIKFYPGDKKDNSPLEYRGEKTIKDIINFIKKYAYNKVILEEEISDL